MKVHIKSFGCSANTAEGEMIKGSFSQQDEIVDSEHEAELVVLNICTVKGDKNALDEIRKAKKEGKRITVAGCITPSIVESIKQIDPEAVLVNTHNIENIASLVNTKTDALTQARPIKLLKPRVRKNPVIGIVPISSGCLDACAFCSTRIVKGSLFSYPPELIEREVENCVKDGCSEIWITGQDTCCYGFDRGTNLAKLLKSISELSGDFKIRVGMGNPRHIPVYLRELIDAFRHPKVFKFLHIPLQSGNNDVLKSMRRGHSVEVFEEIVKAFRKEMPEITISTDIIVGYPGETEEQFNDTVKAVERMNADVMNIARYAVRPGTTAAGMNGQVHGSIKKERSRKLTKAYKKAALERNKQWLGWTGEVIVDEQVKNGVTARNYAYKTIIIQQELPLGTKLEVKITDVHSSFLTGLPNKVFQPL